MSASLKVLVPEATVNYIQNPSFRYDTTGWNAVGSTITRVLTYALFGIASLMVTTDGLVMREGVYYRVNDLAGISDPITISAYVRGDGMIHLRLIDSGGKEWVSPAIDAHPEIWQRLEISGFSTGSNDMRLYVETDGSAKAVTFYVDGCQMERKAYATTFCDGDQPGCRWNIMDSASNASRDANTRQGGRWVPLAGPCRENNDIYITVLGGLGMAPIQNNIQPWALAPGSYYQNTKVLDRVVTFNFNIKKEFLPIVRKVNLGPLHEMRQQLIDIFKPDLTGGGEPFLFSYQEEGGRELFINMRYEAGLEGDWDLRNQWAQSFPVRFLATDPILSELNWQVKQIDFEDSFQASKVAARINGAWIYMAGGFNNSVEEFALGKRGEVYAVGTFTTGGVITYNRVTYWNGSSWQTMGTGADGIVHDIAVAPNGDVYVTGDFHNIDGVAANHIAKWNGTLWSAIGTGLDDEGFCLAIAPNGDIYVGGQFHQAGGGNAYHIARWDGIAWNSLGVFQGLNDEVYGITIKQDGSEVYMGGKFSDQNTLAGSALLRITKFDPSTNLFSAVGSGFDNTVEDVRFSPAGILYAVGDFDNSGTTELNHIGKWNGSIWTALSGGVEGGIIYSLDISTDEQIIVVGTFTSAGGVAMRYVAFWNGSSWVNLDIDFSIGATGSVYPQCVIFKNKDIYIGGRFGIPQPTIFSGITTVNNLGTTEAKPLIYIYGPGRLRWIENQTNGKVIYLNLTILDNEEVFIDFRTGKIESTLRGNLNYGMLPGSDFGDFVLRPGENTLAVFMSDSVQSLMYLGYHPQHWSVDATIDAEPLY